MQCQGKGTNYLVSIENDQTNKNNGRTHAKTALHAKSDFSDLLEICMLVSYIIHHFSGAPRGAFQQPVYNKYKVRWLRVLARPLQAVHNVFLSETLSCARS